MPFAREENQRRARAGFAQRVEHGGDNGRAIEPGDVEKSLLIKAVRYTDSELQMPTKGKLPAEEIAILEQWVKQGAADPRVTVAAGKKLGIDLEKGRKFWAFQPVADPKPPAVKNKAWPIDPVDRFTLAKLERAKLRPVTDADRYTWLRRVSLTSRAFHPHPLRSRSLSTIARHRPLKRSRIVC